ncbi:alpha/beta hydrolase [Spirochaeta thermophila]|uniref:Serine aminopeptidase S33 domain-containing protein n=1 Tax=Winmispira thermophila (strain ATCC 49972 / DSM 6192 / RI 19.B1) TaxID=665571 RepID=E0RSY8_WINT6|nr:alpha/beta hydrolase [Spirochaeta thermophila]ADN02125.1 hypothetical protein STHERM_c11840 [Spirochaeta thermophila DSM 6192]
MALRSYEEHVVDHAGVRLFYRLWIPDRVKAVVIVAHGFGEHSGNFVELAGRLADEGCAVYAPDHYGHGQSGGARGYIPSWDVFHGELSLFREKAVRDFLDRPVFLYGHSMGGTIVLEYAATEGEGLAGVVASAPALSLEGIPPWRRTLGRLLAALLPGLRIPSGLDTGGLTRDPVMLKRLLSDPLSHGLGSPRLVVEMEGAIERCHERAPGLTIPLLVLQGRRDHVVSPPATERFFQHAGSSDKRLLWVEEGLHKLEHDLARQHVLEEVLLWVRTHLPAR